MHTIRIPGPGDCAIFFDFDNTITPFDVLDDIVKSFSIDDNWQEFERLWKEGRIGSRACLEGQLRSVRVSRSQLLDYLLRIKVDPSFHGLLRFLRQAGLRPVILSDNFAFVIRGILRNNGISGVKVYANNLRFDRDRLEPVFPHGDNSCRRCAHCKKKNLLRNKGKKKKIVYIGDGLSDICPAESSDIVFAKGSLLRHFRKKKRPCLPFKSLKEVLGYFRGLKF